MSDAPPRASLGAFLVTFARQHMLEDTVRKILAQTRRPEVLLIVDNEASEATRELIEKIDDPILVYEAMPSNLGSAGGTSHGFETVAAQGYDWVYCGDDDNPPRTTDTIERLMTVVEAESGDVGGIGAGGSRWIDEIGELRRIPDEDLKGKILDVGHIGAGFQCIMRGEALRKGLIPERRFFFGFPDIHHCLSIRKAGYRLLVHGDLMLEYRRQAGRLKLEKKKSLTPVRPYHGVWRTYYTTRNYIWMMREVFDRPDLARRWTLRALAKMVTAWLRGPRYALLFWRMQIKGIRDGYRGKLGLEVLPQNKPA